MFLLVLPPCFPKAAVIARSPRKIALAFLCFPGPLCMPDKLIKRHIDAAPPTPAGKFFFGGGEFRGFGFRPNPGGAKPFLTQYPTRRGQTRRLALGSYGVLTVEQARTLAK